MKPGENEADGGAVQERGRDPESRGERKRRRRRGRRTSVLTTSQQVKLLVRVPAVTRFIQRVGEMQESHPSGSQFHLIMKDMISVAQARCGRRPLTPSPAR